VKFIDHFFVLFPSCFHNLPCTLHPKSPSCSSGESPPLPFVYILWIATLSFTFTLPLPVLLPPFSPAGAGTNFPPLPPRRTNFVRSAFLLTLLNPIQVSRLRSNLAIIAKTYGTSPPLILSPSSCPISPYCSPPLVQFERSSPASNPALLFS